MTDPNESSYRHVQDTAQSMVEVAAGVLGADAASLWRYDDERAYLLARFPEGRAPSTLEFARMPEVAAAIKASETSLYLRDDCTPAVRAWMQAANTSVALRLPVETDAVPNHFLGLAWERADHPPVDTLLPIARRFAPHIALALTRVAARRTRVEAALELSDNVAQALVLAKNYLHLGDHEDAEKAIDQALAVTQHIMTRISRDDLTDNLGRHQPADVMGTGEG